MIGRRSFLAATAATLAIATPPSAIVAGVLETRTYHGCVPGFDKQLEQAMRSASIEARLVQTSPLTYECRFADAVDRNAAWARLNTLAGWPAAAQGFQRYEFELSVE